MENKVLATVGEKKITQEDLNIALKYAPREQAAQFNTFEGKKYLLNEMIMQELIYLDAKDKGLDKDSAYQSELEALKENLLKQYAINQLLKSVTVEEADARAYYESHINQFQQGESVRARHILIHDEESAKEALAELKSGKSFEEAAAELSECPSRGQGGDLGYFERGKMVREFENAAFELESGQVSDLVKTQFGYHIIKVEDKKEASVIPYEQVKGQIISYLEKNMQNKKVVEHANQLRDDYPITIFEDQLI
ncbi:peptidyl-prolyl cis-trans isomerase C [Geosporobacter subterraneus DSM 17957]|uniref:Peptidyl-prolyl cis-trans isomerase C n=1 Tax=Geosporobacter subterraneus DSM 17957 TaxID=1121919 RepID=A0A1M6IG77_9FIRM|nr:peptidylprolyl isomerase [Geosporobacter subterraneus]SHJ33423.1 peptidyl-prolyl cis-trans isomerase C [Geosporobacter subterraneus DSM 17957]